MTSDKRLEAQQAWYRYTDAGVVSCDANAPGAFQYKESETQGLEAQGKPPIVGEEELVRELTAKWCKESHPDDIATVSDAIEAELLPIIRTYLAERVAREVSAAMEQVTRNVEDLSKDAYTHGVSWGELKTAIAELSPLPYAKLVAEARLDEAKWWRHLVIMDDESYFAVEGDKRIAELRTAKGDTGQ